MKIDQRYNGIAIGAIFMLASLLFTFTLVVPMLSVIPGAFLESIMASIVDNEPYSNVGKATILVLSSMLIISMIFVLVISRQMVFRNSHIIAIMSFEYFILHPLGFYIYWATFLDFRNDGQLIFGAVSSFPISSLSFVVLGLLIDLIKKKS